MKNCYLHTVFENKEMWLEKSITIRGWIKSKRMMKNVCFVELNDGTCMENLQLVADRNQSCYELLRKAEIGATVCVEGKLKSHPYNNSLELHMSNFEVIGHCHPEYPIQNNKMGLEYLREIPHLRTRLSYFEAVFKIRSVLVTSIHEFFVKNHFMNINTPIITSSDCEGAGELFRVTTLRPEKITDSEKCEDTDRIDYFGRRTYLTVSGQLELEAMVCSFGKVYGLGPVFRADNSNTKRHASEFWMMETEMAFVDLEDAMQVAEETIKYLIEKVLQNCKNELDYLSKRQSSVLIQKLTKMLASEFKQVQYSDALEILRKSNMNFEHSIEYGHDLKTEHIKYLTKYYHNCPFFIINHPKELQPFYVCSNPDGRTVASSILYFPEIGDVIGVCQKEADYQKLKKRINDLGMKEDSYEWYLNLRKYGSVPHSGFGLGVERILMFLTGTENIRDVIAFPRTKCKKWI